MSSLQAGHTLPLCSRCLRLPNGTGLQQSQGCTSKSSIGVLHTTHPALPHPILAHCSSAASDCWFSTGWGRRTMNVVELLISVAMVHYRGGFPSSRVD